MLTLAMLGTAIGFVASDERAANTQFDRTHQSLDTIRHSIDGVVSRLDATRRELVSVNGQVGAEAAALAKDASQLKGAATALANAQAHVSDQATVLRDLQTCLGGVQQALNALAVGGQSLAISALDSVASSCQGAVAASG
jgi:chromosome segregation ATPase